MGFKDWLKHAFSSEPELDAPKQATPIPSKSRPLTAEEKKNAEEHDWALYTELVKARAEVQEAHNQAEAAQLKGDVATAANLMHVVAVKHARITAIKGLFHEKEKDHPVDFITGKLLPRSR